MYKGCFAYMTIQSIFNRYKIQLDGPNGELNTGSIQCKMQGSYVGTYTWDRAYKASDIMPQINIKVDIELI